MLCKQCHYRKKSYWRLLASWYAHSCGAISKITEWKLDFCYKKVKSVDKVGSRFYRKKNRASSLFYGICYKFGKILQPLLGPGISTLRYVKPVGKHFKISKSIISSSIKLHNRDRVMKCRHLSMSPSSPSLLAFQKFVYFRRGQKLSFEQVLWAERIPGHHPSPNFHTTPLIPYLAHTYS